MGSANKTTRPIAAVSARAMNLSSRGAVNVTWCPPPPLDYSFSLPGLAGTWAPTDKYRLNPTWLGTRLERLWIRDDNERAWVKELKPLPLNLSN
jgi:hypothetical protein